MPREDLISAAAASEMVGGSAQLRKLVRTGRLPVVNPFGARTMKGMLFRRPEVEAAAGLAVEPQVATVYVIGFSKDVRGRILALQQNLPVSLEVFTTFPGTRATERALHDRFANLRLNGEWFQKRGRLLRWLNDGCPQPDAKGEAP